MDESALHGVSFADGEKVVLVRYVNGEKIILVKHVDEETKNKINLDPEYLKEFIRKELLNEEKNGSENLNTSVSEKPEISLVEDESIRSTVEIMKEFIRIEKEKNDGEKVASPIDPEKSEISLIEDESIPSTVDKKKWTHEITQLMLSTIADYKSDFMFASKKKRVFIRVKNKLLEYGHSFNVSEISKKYSNLIQTYRRQKEKRNKGEESQNWIYFDIIDEIVGNNYGSSPKPKKHISSSLLPEKIKIYPVSRSPSPISPLPSTSKFDTSKFEEYHGKRKRTSLEERESIEERKLKLLENLIKARKRESPPEDDNVVKKIQKLNSSVDMISESAQSMAESARSIASSVNKLYDLLATNCNILRKN
ncbi:hypothetical protein Avbf_07957 [Armadillidium vulgare]|nr:hypothetical protein Avbf_07957 [Armadillidium vulgare]